MSYVSGRSVPHEFVGLARQLWRRIEVEDVACIKVLDRIEDILVERLRRKPTLRPEHVIDIERRWRAMPCEFRFFAPSYEHPKKLLRIREMRLSAHTAHASGWEAGEREQGLSVCLVTCEVTKGGAYTFSNQPLATVALHAVARRFQRGRDRSEAAVLADLFMLAAGLLNVERPDPGVVAIDGGEWRGLMAKTEIQNGDGEVLARHAGLAVRTFIDSDQWERVQE